MGRPFQYRVLIVIPMEIIGLSTASMFFGVGGPEIDIEMIMALCALKRPAPCFGLREAKGKRDPLAREQWSKDQILHL